MVSRSFIRGATFAVFAGAALLAPVLANADSGIARGGISTPLTLLNGWKNAPSGTSDAAISEINGIVHLKGAIRKGGDNAEPFVLPAPYRPAAKVYVTVDACNSHNARLDIFPTGDVTVETEGNFKQARCLISLDGATFALSTDGFKPLKLKHNWYEHGFETANAAVQMIDGMVHFEGAISTSGKNAVPFVLPPSVRPDHRIYVKTNLCNATNGRLFIVPNGTTTVQFEKKFANASCFTSLDGVSFASNANSFTPLTLINGWTAYSSFTANPAVRVFNGLVQFEGAIATTGTNPEAFVLPSGFRPSKTVYVPVDLCGATNGRLVISPNGDVTVEAENDFGNAQCFTSLEGVTFAP
jgi:hypothetical protein